MNTNKNLERSVPGCLGRMVNLFDLNTHVGGNRLLTEKPHYEGSPVTRSQSDMSRSYVVDDHTQMVSELGKSPSNRKTNGTPMKMLMAQEMSKEEVYKKDPPSLVAKLMGLDDLPQRDPFGSASCRTNLTGSRSRSNAGSVEFIQKDHDGIYKDGKNEKNMALIREKFMEAKRLSTDEKLRQSKQFQDALEVLNSNKDLFLKFLQEPNSLFSQHHNLPSIPPRPDSKRITILKPSKFVDNHKLPQDKFSENHYQLTRIVVLKPKGGNLNETRAVSSSPSSKTLNNDGFYAYFEDNKPEESSSSHIRDETLLFSVLSNGYNGDESSFGKSEVYYAAGNLSDSEVMSPTSRHSWDYDRDYINRFGSPYSSSSFSHAPCSLESSVCREAKKRLSERWAMMSLNRSGQEQRHVRRNSSTLGEMLALSDFKNTSNLNKNKGHPTDAYSSLENLVRSKSLSVSSTEFLNSKKYDDTKDLTIEKSQHLSLFKGNVSRLFFSRSRKSGKQKSQMSDDEVHQSSCNIGNECINDIVVKDIGQQLTEGSGNANEPSPISVLESQFKDDDHTSSCSSTAKLNKIGVDPNKYNLIDKSPPIGSISRTLSLDHYAVGSVTPILGKTSTKPLGQEEEEQECFLYVQTLLSAAGNNNGVQSDSVIISRWHSPESPLDPSLRDKYMSLTNKEPVHQSKQRNQRSFQRLVFDCVNEVLASATREHMGKLTMDHVWCQMKEWISGEEMCDWDGDGGDEDGGSAATVAVERAVRREVVSEVWMENLKLEIEDVKHEIEGKLVEQLVEELIGGVICC